MEATPLTKYPGLDRVLRELAGLLQDALGEEIVGIYLQGSLAIGDFDLTSDVDFVVVTREELTLKKVRLAQEVHTKIFGHDNRWVRHLEYSYFPLDVLRSPSSPFTQSVRDDSEGRAPWYFDNGRAIIERSDHDNTLVVRRTLRERGVVVSEPEPSELLEVVSTHDLRTEIQRTLVGWGDMVLEDPEPYRNRFYQSFLVLNYCRGLLDLTEGSIHSKLAGVKWARENVDPAWRSLIDFCWEERNDTEISVNQPADPNVFDQTIDFGRHSVNRMRNLII